MARKSRQRGRLRTRAVVISVGSLLALTAAVVALKATEAGRLRKGALAEADRLEKEGRGDLAARHLSHYLRISPDDVGALDRLGRVAADLAASADDLLVAAQVNDQLLRLDPDGPGRQATRRRLAELYVRYSDAYRGGASFSDLPESASHHLRYRAAEAVAREAVRRDGRDGPARRLLAMALEGLAVPGDPGALAASVAAYEGALRLDPGDVTSASRLAGLYRGRMRDPEKAARVLDALLRAGPGRVGVRLARYEHFSRFGDPARASAELREAVRLSPGDVTVRVASAGDALRRGDLKAARIEAGAVPAGSRDDPRVRLVRGLIEYADLRTDRAVGEWRAGLLASGGTDAELTWWLAAAQIQAGRVDEAAPLVSQYQRVVGTDQAPMARLLRALLDEKAGRTREALEALERLRDRAAGSWRSVYYQALGRCYEAAGDGDRALAAYRQAAQADASAAPRLGIARVLSRGRPDDALAELRRELKASPGSPALRAALADALFRRQAALPPARRSWGEFDAAWREADAVDPDAPALVLLMAERRSLGGDPEGALALWAKATRLSPRDPSAWLAYAGGLGRLGKADRAAEILEEASSPSAAGDLAPIRVARAGLLRSMGRGREGRARMVRNLDRLPLADRCLVRAAEGRLLAEQGDPAGARAAYLEWARIDPENPAPGLSLLELALAYEDAAARSASAALRGLGAPNGPADRLGRALERLGADPARGGPALAEALALLDGLPPDAREAPAVSLLRGRLQERLGKAEAAVDEYRRAWQGGQGPALPRLVSLLARGRRRDELAALRRPSAEGGADPAPATAGRSRAARVRRLVEAGKAGEAEAVVRAAVEEAPGEEARWAALLRFQAEQGRLKGLDATVARARGLVKSAAPDVVEARCRWAAGDWRGAERAFARTVSARPGDAAAALAAASFFEATRRPAAAAEHLRRALAIDPARRPVARQLAATLSEVAPDFPGWEQALAALGPEPAGPDTPEDRMARALVIARCPDEATRRGAVGRLEDLLADLPAGHAVAADARDVLTRALLRAGMTGRACEVAAVSAARGEGPEAAALYVEALLRHGDHARAERQLDVWSCLAPGDRREARWRVRLITERERLADAPAALERAYLDRGDGPPAEAFGREAVLRLSGMGPDAAPAAARLARRLAARSPGCSWALARVALKDGRPGEALQLCRKAVDSGTPVDVVEAGWAATEVAAAAAGDSATLSGAGAVVDAALSREPGSDDLLKMTAMIRHLQGRYEEEADVYRSLLARQPGHPVALNNLAWVLSESLGRPAEGLAPAEALSRQVGAGRLAPCTRGVILIRLGRAAEAVRELEDAVKRGPSALGSYYLALAYRRADRVDDARRSLAAAKEAGLSPSMFEPSQRVEYEALLASLAR